MNRFVEMIKRISAIAFLSVSFWAVRCPSAAACSPGVDNNSNTLGVSADPARPARLNVGRVVSARLENSKATGSHHYWCLELDAGSYKVVLDVWNGSDLQTAVKGKLDLVDESGRVVETVMESTVRQHPKRTVIRFGVPTTNRRSFRYTSESGVSDYWLGVYLSSDDIKVPFFSPLAPEALTLTAGGSGIVSLDGARATHCEAHFVAHLVPGTYRVGLTLEAANLVDSEYLTGDLGSQVSVLDKDGGHQFELFSVSNRGKRITHSSGFVQTKTGAHIFRVRSRGGKIKATFSISASEAGSDALRVVPDSRWRIRLSGEILFSRLIDDSKQILLANLAKQSRSIELNLIIAPTGEVASSRCSSTDTAVCKTLVEEVARWRFRPMLLNSQPAEMIASFRLGASIKEAPQRR